MSRKSGHLLESIDIVPFFVPLNLQTASHAGTTSDWIRMKAHTALIVFFKGQGTAGDDPTVTLDQATDNAGTSSKSLSSISVIYTKEEGAANLLTTTSWTKTTQTAAATYTTTTSAERSLIWAIPLDAKDMDCDGGFDFFRLTLNDVGTNDQFGCAFCIFGDLHHGGPVANHDSALS